MAEKPGRNDPCSCGSGKKYKKCCGVKKKLQDRNANVVSKSPTGSLFNRLHSGGASEEGMGSLKDRVSKAFDQTNKKKNEGS